MKETWNWTQVGLMTIGGFLGWFLGGVDGSLFTLLAFVIVDYLTGVLRAITEKKLSSQIGSIGITKKVMIFLLVGIAHMLDVEIIGNGNVLRDAVIFFYISNEGISIIENAVKIGLPIPEKLKDVLEQITKHKEDK
ncbi:toxin secretion/phage lysis holin [Pilibacter termitis]|uniref:Toxin secretion/phage lysis holin n=1 Tax=Pilibacter termitis TaxID=263852 RepID=A0A1T4R6T8_9ENTE|nr:phage holin family protein [Pilibacter termitis]SKA11655.1 toxin secretion/phage lysis holin [Pilibacter termitis]